MKKSWAVFKREFGSMVRSRMYLFGTLFGPFLISLFIALQILFSGGGGSRSLVVVDETPTGLGEVVAEALTSAEGPAARVDLSFTVDLARPAPGRDDAIRIDLRRLVSADSIDAFVWLPAGLAAGDTALYVGRQASRGRDQRAIRGAVDEAVRSSRLRDAGIDPSVLARAFSPVAYEARSMEPDGDEGAASSGEAVFVLVYVMVLTLYVVILLYGNAVLRGVREEKDDRIVEILLSSLKPEQLMAGKVFGIGTAALLQVAVWAAFGILVVGLGDRVVEAFGGRIPDLPTIPASAAVIFVAYFAGGFLLYSAIYAALGAVATSGQEAQHLQYPVIAPLVIGMFMSFAVIEAPRGTVATIGTLVPFTSPLVVPVRATIAGVPAIELIASAALLVGGCLGMLWIGGRVYRVTILATGQRPSMATIWRWVRSG